MSFADFLQTKLGAHITENVIRIINNKIMYFLYGYLNKIDRRINT